MSDDEYTFEDLQKDLDFLVAKGLIEIGGIDEQGRWLYKATEASLAMTEEEQMALIMSELDNEEE